MEKVVSELYNAFKTKKGNLVWIGTMCLTWNDFARFSKVKALEFATNNPVALKTISNFNNSSFSDKDIDSKSIYVKTGKGKATQTLINKEVKQKFPNYSFPDLDLDMDDSAILAFAYLYKQLSFAAKLERAVKEGVRFNGKEVDSFCASNEDQKKQIRVNMCESKNEFMLSILQLVLILLFPIDLVLLLLLLLFVLLLCKFCIKDEVFVPH